MYSHNFNTTLSGHIMITPLVVVVIAHLNNAKCTKKCHHLYNCGMCSKYNEVIGNTLLAFFCCCCCCQHCIWSTDANRKVHLTSKNVRRKKSHEYGWICIHTQTFMTIRGRKHNIFFLRRILKPSFSHFSSISLRVLCYYKLPLFPRLIIVDTFRRSLVYYTHISPRPHWGNGGRGDEYVCKVDFVEFSNILNKLISFQCT